MINNSTKTLFAIALILFIFISGCKKNQLNNHDSSTQTITDNGQDREVLFALKLWEHWALVVGADSPIFTLYNDKSIIYYDKEERTYKYVKLREEEFTTLSQNLWDPNIATLQEFYNTTNVTCQNMYHFFFRHMDKEYFISIYGHPIEEIYGNEPAPDEIKKVFSQVLSFKHKDALNWLPAKIEVILWPDDHTSKDLKKWPDDWPDLHDPNTVQRGKQIYSIYLDSKHFNKLKKFIQKARYGVLINGQNKAISYRFPIPGENVFHKLTTKNPY